MDAGHDGQAHARVGGPLSQASDGAPATATEAERLALDEVADAGVAAEQGEEVFGFEGEQVLCGREDDHFVRPGGGEQLEA